MSCYARVGRETGLPDYYTVNQTTVPLMVNIAVNDAPLNNDDQPGKRAIRKNAAVVKLNGSKGLPAQTVQLAADKAIAALRVQAAGKNGGKTGAADDAVTEAAIVKGMSSFYFGMDLW